MKNVEKLIAIIFCLILKHGFRKIIQLKNQKFKFLKYSEFEVDPELKIYERRYGITNFNAEKMTIENEPVEEN